jgi:hypothetical protein
VWESEPIIIVVIVVCCCLYLSLLLVIVSQYYSSLLGLLLLHPSTCPTRHVKPTSNSLSPHVHPQPMQPLV